MFRYGEEHLAHRGRGLRHERKGAWQEPGRPLYLRSKGPGEDSRVTKVQAISATAATGGETNRTAVRTVAMGEDN